MTAVGSVFLLQGDIAERLDTLIRQGLPLPTFGHGAAALDWRNSPFVPESGFGEIRADHLSDKDLSAGVEHV